MPRPRMLALAVTVSMIAAAFGAAPTLAQDEAPQPPTATPNPVPHDVPAGDGTGVRLSTDLGDFVIGLYNESAPVAAENFVNLVESGYYDGIGFHRIVRDFVIQGGDPEGTGMGGPGYTIADEEVVGEYGRGIVAMARTQAPDSQGSQFFVVLDDGARPALKSANTYVIFGEVLGDGMDVVDAIAERGPEANVIEDPVRINSATIEQVELPAPPPPSAARVAANALAARMPTEVSGIALDGDVFTSDDILPDSAENPTIEELTQIADENGGDIGELSIVTRAGTDGVSGVTILASSIAGVDADLTKAPLMELVLRGTAGSEITEQVIAGQNVTIVQADPDGADADSIKVLALDDIVWFLVGDPVSVEAAIGMLASDDS